MVDIMGHIAFGLLFAVPAWFVWGRRASAAFVGLAAVAALLPDVDLWLQWLLPGVIHHHGVMHTVVFVVLASVVLGGIVAVTLNGRLNDWIDDEYFGTQRLFTFSFAAILAGSLSHLVADMLSAPDISTPIEPFWPLFNKPWAVDLVWYNAWWINVGFLALMVVLHLILAYTTTSSGRREDRSSVE